MPYEVVATAKTPALIIYLIDISSSMTQELDGAAKIAHVNQALEQVLIRMVQRSTKGELISPRYRLAMAAYSEHVSDMLEGIKTIDEVAKKGPPQLSTVTTTDTAAAFAWARDLLRRELPHLDRCPAPLICHLTDGRYTSSDPAPIAQEIMQMANSDGHVLIENIYVGPNLTKQPIADLEAWPGLREVSELNDQYAERLFHMSSLLPESYANVILEEEFGLQAGSRMLIPGTSKALIELAFTMSGATPIQD